MCGSLRSQPRAHAGNGARRGHDRRRHTSTRGARRRPGASAWRGLPQLPLRPLGGPAMRVPAICAGPAGRLPIRWRHRACRCYNHSTPLRQAPRAAQRPVRSRGEVPCLKGKGPTRASTPRSASCARALNYKYQGDTHETLQIHIDRRTPPPAGPHYDAPRSLDAPYSHLPACFSDFSPHRGCELLASCGRPIPACRAHARNFTGT